jgi:triacylglycerol lipase
MSTVPQLKPLPPAPDLLTQVTLLTRPEENPSGYEPFADAAQFPFEPTACEWSRANAWWLAEACWLSYFHDDNAVKAIYRSRVGLDCVCLDRSGTQCTIASSPEFAIVAFRGTQPDQWADIMADGRYLPIDWHGVTVHRGFAAALDSVWDPLAAKLAALPPACRVWFTGHSLGAALATLAALRFERNSAVYTFGSPLTGNQVFAGLFNSRFGSGSIRYVNDHDVVTRVPPEEFAFPHGRYAHVDALRWIDADGVVRSTTTLPPPRFFSSVFGSMKLLLFLFEHAESSGLPALPDALRDHTPLHYVIHAWNDLVRATKP